MHWEQLRQRYDKKDVLGWLRHFPDQCIEAIYIGNRFKPKRRRFDKIVACGMGGSGIGAALLRNMLKDELHIPFEVFNSYRLPPYINSRTLVFCVSVSGNTEETLNCFNQAKKKKVYTISLTKNGKLWKAAKTNKIKLPAAIPQPRMAVAYQVIPMLIILQRLGLIEKKNGQLNEMVFLLKKEHAKIEEKAKELALKLRGKLPVIYASEELQSVAYRFRTDLNEYSKQFALHHFLPEQNHNEINAYLGLKRNNSEFVFLRHRNEEKKIAKRFAVLKKIFRKKFNITEVQLEGKSLLAATFYALFLISLTSYYLGLLNHVDPEKIPVIAQLKKELGK